MKGLPLKPPVQCLGWHSCHLGSGVAAGPHCCPEALCVCPQEGNISPGLWRLPACSRHPHSPAPGSSKQLLLSHPLLFLQVPHLHTFGGFPSLSNKSQCPDASPPPGTSPCPAPLLGPKGPNKSGLNEEGKIPSLCSGLGLLTHVQSTDPFGAHTDPKSRTGSSALALCLHGFPSPQDGAGLAEGQTPRAPGSFTREGARNPVCWGRQQETAWLRIQRGCPVAPVPPAQRRGVALPLGLTFPAEQEALISPC